MGALEVFDLLYENQNLVCRPIAHELGAQVCIVVLRYKIGFLGVGGSIA